MTDNDFQKTLDACGLSKKGAAKLFKVRYDTVKNWYYGRAKVPDGVMLDLWELEQCIDMIFGKDCK